MWQGIVVLVVTDDEEGLRTRLADMGQESLGAAGVVAITGPRGYGTTRILTELQQAWLLGYGDVSIVSPVSVLWSELLCRADSASTFLRLAYQR